ncbi:MAG: YHYH protein [Aquaticitalea sp.]
MTKQNKILTILLSLVLLSCNGGKHVNSHSHDGISYHTHDDEHQTNEPIDYFGNYTIEDAHYGTKTIVTVSGNTRTMVTNAIPNHKTGSFPNPGNPNTISEQNRTYTFPVNPKKTGKAQWIREPGIALNGIKFEPGTAEVVECETGENYRVEALQDVIDMGLDFNHAHVQPTGAYHYHGTPTSVIEEFDSGEDLVHIGFAHDGFPMYYSKSGKYKPSYKALAGNREGENCVYENPGQHIDVSVGGHHDGTFTSDFEYVSGSGDLDECNGITIDGNYMYLVTAEFPYISRCVMGEVPQEEQRQVGMEGGQGNPNGKPNIGQLFTEMDSNKDGQLSKDEVKGPLSDDFDKIDSNKDGIITKEELKKIPQQKGKQGQGRPPRD